MSDTDKTREKLLSSIRKTKAGATAKTEPAPEPAEPARPSTPARRSATSKAATTTSRAQRAPQRQETQDPYQGGRRVWPD
ncbi:MAG: hypothetical protein PVG82_05925 [Chromatiales bacterium]|jgi:hypothetical protein